MRKTTWLMLALGVPATLFCAYSCAFWSWVTATPLTPQQLARAQFNANAWLTLTALSLTIAIVAIVLLVRQRRKTMRGFDVLGSDAHDATSPEVPKADRIMGDTIPARTGQMSADLRQPRERDVYEALDDVPVDYMTHYFDLPYTGGGAASLPKGERVRVTYARGEKPLGVYCDPLRYDELHERLVPATERSRPAYRGYYLAISTAVLNNSFKQIECVAAGR